MNSRRAFAAMGLWACAPAWAAAATARLRLRLIAEPFPPLQYTDPSGKVRGAAYELVKTALAEVSAELPLEVVPLEFMPLQRALQTAASQPNIVVLSIARTPEREARFRWLGTVSPYELWLYRHRQHAMPAVHDVAQLRGQGLRFGAQAGSNFHEWLLRQGIGTPPDNSSIDAVPQNSLNFGKAQLGRIDVFAHPDVSFAYRATENHLHAADFEKVLRIDELSMPLWAATHPRTDARLAGLIEQALQRLHHSGQAERMRHEALKEFNALYRLGGH